MSEQFFAVPDPDDPAVLTFWRRHESGMLMPWPKGARYGPRMPWTPGRSVREQLRSARWASEHFRPWLARVETAVEADPEAAGRAFAKTKVRCRVCGRHLSDRVSRDLGVGPDCRAGAQ